MKRYLIITILWIVLLLNGYSQQVVPPSVQTATSFAIVIDSVSYAKTKDAVDAYKKVVEEDHLATYILVHNWNSPDEIKSLLINLSLHPTSPLEGALFIGEIPIPMLRDAQHLTSAFKMDQERYPLDRSSVPSDRFYDDFDLKFDFIKRDEANRLYFYYSLRHDGAQILNPDIYTARIMPYDDDGGDRYVLLRRYLERLVSERRNNRDNLLNVLSMGRGHSYNSESKAAWAGEQMALKEQLPDAFSPRGRVRFMDFDSPWPIKDSFLDEVQKPGLDLMLFHHHGAKDTQYLNGYRKGSDPNISKENIRMYGRSKIRSAAEKKGREEAIRYYMNLLDIPRSWVDDSFDDTRMAEDSLYNLMLDIHLHDIRSITPTARVIMLDACYNGSFHEKENVAGAYLFGGGETMVVQGNTVNVLQDKWPDEFLGLLAAGMRVGNWHRHVAYLETHLIGDPTFHFSNSTDISFDLNEVLFSRKDDADFWLSLLAYPVVDLQALALRKLFECGYPEISELLRDTYLHAPDMIVRCETFLLLSRIRDENYMAVLASAAMDSYELIRRFAIEQIYKNGSAQLVPTCLHNYFWDASSERVQFKHRSHQQLLPSEAARHYLHQTALHSPHHRKRAEELERRLAQQDSLYQEQIPLLTTREPTVTKKAILNEIRSFRNYPDNRVIDPLLSLIADPSKEQSLRIAAAEALGWYRYSCRRDYIVEQLRLLCADRYPEKIDNEISKTILRLSSR